MLVEEITLLERLKLEDRINSVTAGQAMRFKPCCTYDKKATEECKVDSRLRRIFMITKTVPFLLG